MRKCLCKSTTALDSCESRNDGGRRRGWGVPRRPVSRVLFPARKRRAATIYLAATLPSWSCGQPRESPGVRNPLFGLAPDGVCLCLRCYHQSGALLPRLFTLTSTVVEAVCFLLHFPSGCPAPPLAGILPGGARTFLSPAHGGTAVAQPPWLVILYHQPMQPAGSVSNQMEELPLHPHPNLPPKREGTLGMR